MKKMRKELQIGLLAFSLYLLVNYYFPAFDFLLGILLGTAVCFEAIGILPEHIYLKLKERKKFLKRIFR